jgi:hypothetical protein
VEDDPGLLTTDQIAVLGDLLRIIEGAPAPA